MSKLFLTRNFLLKLHSISPSNYNRIGFRSFVNFFSQPYWTTSLYFRQFCHQNSSSSNFQNISKLSGYISIGTNQLFQKRTINTTTYLESQIKIKNYYIILGLKKSASQREIKNAYIRRAKKFHPDVIRGSEEKFQEIQEAYEILSNQEKRANYDQDLTKSTKEFLEQKVHYPIFWTQEGNRASLMRVFDQLFGRPSRNKEDPSWNSSQRFFSAGCTYHMLELRLTPEEALKGAEKEVELVVPHFCDLCKGTGIKAKVTPKKCSTCNNTGYVYRFKIGFLNLKKTCPSCRGFSRVNPNLFYFCNQCVGRGTMLKSTIETLSIPPGVDNRSIYRTRQDGNDIYVRVIVSED